MKTRYKFSHRGKGMDGKEWYWWYSGPIPGDSRVESISIRVEEFWNPPLCMSRGPRIGDGQPRCKRPEGHKGLHQSPVEDGWGPHMKWGIALHSKPGYYL